MGSARRYLAVVQAPEGYPPQGEPLEDGLVQPMIHHVVLADDYEAAAAERDSWKERCAELQAVVGKVPQQQLARIVRTLTEEAQP